MKICQKIKKKIRRLLRNDKKEYISKSLLDRKNKDKICTDCINVFMYKSYTGHGGSFIKGYGCLLNEVINSVTGEINHIKCECVKQNVYKNYRCEFKLSKRYKVKED